LRRWGIQLQKPMILQIQQVHMIKPDETVDPLGLTDLRMIQPQKGYRFSMDPFLLCGFSGFRDARVIYDLGCGNGVIPLLAAARSTAEKIVGVERQPQMVERARRSAELNSLQDRVTIVEGDLRLIRQSCPPQQADLVLANPPYRVAGNGRISPDDERAAARHELAGGLATFLEAANYLLKDGGRCCLVFLTERLAELMALMQRLDLEPKRLRLVHHTVGETARMVLVEGVRKGRPGLVAEAPLVVYTGEEKGYTKEVLAMYAGNGTRDD
jgi:tRNA1Val (adenine37-N6)-methyltransferase